MPTTIEIVTVDATVDDFEATLTAAGVINDLSPQPETIGDLIVYPTCSGGDPAKTLAPGDTIEAPGGIATCDDAATWLDNQGYRGDPSTPWTGSDAVTVQAVESGACSVHWSGENWTRVPN